MWSSKKFPPPPAHHTSTSNSIPSKVSGLHPWKNPWFDAVYSCQPNRPPKLRQSTAATHLNRQKETKVVWRNKKLSFGWCFNWKGWGFLRKERPPWEVVVSWYPESVALRLSFDGLKFWYDPSNITSMLQSQPKKLSSLHSQYSSVFVSWRKSMSMLNSCQATVGIDITESCILLVYCLLSLQNALRKRQHDQDVLRQITPKHTPSHSLLLTWLWFSSFFRRIFTHFLINETHRYIGFGERWASKNLRQRCKLPHSGKTMAFMGILCSEKRPQKKIAESWVLKNMRKN